MCAWMVGRERLLQALDGLLWRPGASPVPTADDDLLAALADVATWHRQGDAITLMGAKTLRFRLNTN